MARSDYAWTALSHGQTYLSSVAMGEELDAPIITQAVSSSADRSPSTRLSWRSQVYTGNNAAHQAAIMLAGAAQHLDLAQEYGGEKGYLAQDVSAGSSSPRPCR